MTITLTAVFDGKVLQPEEPLDLPANARYQITVTPLPADGDATATKEKAKNIWDILDQYAGSIEAPEDWASEHDHYLYGTPKRSERTQQ